MYVWKQGRKTASVGKMLIAVILMVYPYFIDAAWLTWLVGSALFALSFKVTA